MELFYTAPQNISTETAAFDEFESRHIIKTLRKKTGDKINFTDGAGNLYEALIDSVQRTVSCKFLSKKSFPFPSPSLTIAVGFIRQARLDILIEKATELGVTQFFLFASNHTNYYTSNVHHWEKIIRQAIKQSNRFYLPEIRTFKSFDAMISASSEFRLKIITDQSGDYPLTALAPIGSNDIPNPVIAVVGPEGGLDLDEIRRCHEQNFITATLGSSRLRAETAALTVSAYFNLIK